MRFSLKFHSNSLKFDYLNGTHMCLFSFREIQVKSEPINFFCSFIIHFSRSNFFRIIISSGVPGPIFKGAGFIIHTVQILNSIYYINFSSFPSEQSCSVKKGEKHTNKENIPKFFVDKFVVKYEFF